MIVDVRLNSGCACEEFVELTLGRCFFKNCYDGVATRKNSFRCCVPMKVQLYRKYVSRCLETTLSTRKFELTDWNITGSDVVVGLGDILLFCKVLHKISRICGDRLQDM